MSSEIKDFVRPTQIVRSVMRRYGKKSYMIYTNAYENCRTVKCYSNDKSPELHRMIVNDIRTALVKAGVKDFQIKTVSGRSFQYGMMGASSLIVRIPRTEQA